MSVAELKDRHVAATETVNSLRERLRQRRLALLDTDGAILISHHFHFFFSFFLWSFDLFFLLVIVIRFY